MKELIKERILKAKNKDELNDILIDMIKAVPEDAKETAMDFSRAKIQQLNSLKKILWKHGISQKV